MLLHSQDKTLLNEQQSDPLQDTRRESRAAGGPDDGRAVTDPVTGLYEHKLQDERDEQIPSRPAT